METTFHFGFKPKIHKNQVNYKKAYFKNIIRSFYVNKIRYFKKLRQYNKTIKMIKNTTPEEMKAITTICRPGPLSNSSDFC